MKKFYISFLFLFAVLFSIAQNVSREMVAVEKATGTWCPNCPAAARGVADLLANGKLVAVISNQNGDGYTNQYSNARNNMWNVSGVPSATFDGIAGYVGGSYGGNNYTNYLIDYNTAIARSSPVSMTMEISNSGLDYTVVVTLTKVGTITSTSNVLYFFVTQSNIQQNWQGMTTLEHVNRQMVPNQTGTAVNFSSGNTQTVTLNFAISSAWPIEDLEFIAMLQNKDSGQGDIPGTNNPGYGSLTKWEVYQCIKRAVVDLTLGFTASSTEIPMNGSVTFTNTTYGGYMGASETYQWIFPGATPEFSSEKNPTVVYTSVGYHDVTLIVNRGGQIDTASQTNYIKVCTAVNVNITPNDTACAYQPITLDATTPGATYLWEPGGQTTPSITVDTTGIGLGSHMFAVTVNTPDTCSQYIPITIFFDACTGVAQNKNDLSTILYPNPNQGSFTLEMNSLTPQNISIDISNALGMKVYSESSISFNGKLVKPINLNYVPVGVYYLSIRNSGKNIVQKFLVK